MALKLDSTPPPAVNKPRAAKPSRSAAKTAEREEGMNGLFQLGAALGIMFGQLPDAAACQQHGPPISHEMALLAEDNAGIARVIDYATAAGPFAGVIAAFLPFGLQIMVNHKRIPASPALAQFGVHDPAILEAQVKADVMRQQAEMMRQQAAAEAEMRQLQAEQEAAARQNNTRPQPSERVDA